MSSITIGGTITFTKINLRQNHVLMQQHIQLHFVDAFEKSVGTSIFFILVNFKIETTIGYPKIILYLSILMLMCIISEKLIVISEIGVAILVAKDCSVILENLAGLT